MKLAGLSLLGLVYLGFGATASADDSPAAFRVDTVELRDPHAYGGALFFCLNVTDQVTDVMDDLLNEDDDKDGLLDVSMALVFRPLSQSGVSPFEVHSGECTAPVAAPECGPGDDVVDTEAENLESTACLTPNSSHTGNYSPSPTIPEDPCFVSLPETISLVVAGVPVELTGARVAATYSGDPAQSLVDGLLIGFFSEADAEQTIISDSVPFFAGKPLSSLLPGGKGNCHGDDARDVGPDGVTPGWWLHFNFTAESVPGGTEEWLGRGCGDAPQVDPKDHIRAARIA